MRAELEARLLELLQAEDDDIFEQGLEMLRAGAWSRLDRYLLARALCTKPRRALAVMADDASERRTLKRRYASGCLRALAEREAAAGRPPPAIFTQTLPLLAADTWCSDSITACRQAASALRARGREETMSFSNPARYSSLRLLEVLADLMEGVGTIELHTGALVRQLSKLEPRGPVGYEERDRRALCRAALEAVLSPASGPGPAQP
jgi:hypothetical protein